VYIGTGNSNPRSRDEVRHRELVDGGLGGRLGELSLPTPFSTSFFHAMCNRYEPRTSSAFCSPRLAFLFSPRLDAQVLPCSRDHCPDQRADPVSLALGHEEIGDWVTGFFG
jgi:hypothetical protein